jgi:hypothetical protein
MTEVEKLNLTKGGLREKLENNVPMTDSELLRLNAHNIDGIRIIVNAMFIITVIIPGINGFVFGLNFLFNHQ